MYLVFLGPPGAGKGTQCKRLAEYVQLPHLSTGEIFRQAMKDETELGREAKQFIDQGRLVPDQLVVNIVTERMGQPDCQKGCLLDGFPRTVQQAESLDEYLQSRGKSLAVVLELRAPEEELQRRMLQRSKIENRADDTPETIAARFKVYHEETEPLVQYYSAKGVLKPVDGIGSMDEVFSRIKDAVDSHR